MINLQEKFEEFRSLAKHTLSNFETKYSDVLWSTYAFDATPVYGYLRLNFDTAKNSEHILKTYPNWYKEDSAGKFNDNCSDYRFGAFVELEIPDWEQEFFESHENFEYIDTYGKQHIVNMEDYVDEGFNKIVFEMLTRVVDSEANWVRTNSRHRDSPARFGVQMCDSQYTHFTLL